MLKQFDFANCREMATSDPVHVLDFDRGHPIFDTDALENLLEGSTKNEVFVIGITGLYRTGKSFLMNILKCYLDHIVQVSLTNQYLN